MRITAQHTDIIRRTVAEAFTPTATVRVFGSRVNNEGSGGDIDLLVETPFDVERAAFAAASLAARLERLLDGRRVDVVLVTPSTRPQPIHRIARAEGVRL